MKRTIVIFLLAALLLTGCHSERMFQVDTIVDIPLHPTQAAEETQTAFEPTQPAAETAPDPSEATEAPKTGGGKHSGTSTGKGSSSGVQTEPVQTAPSATEPPATEAPTEPPEDVNDVYDISGYGPGGLEYAVLDAINARRTEAGLSALNMVGRLCGIASVRAYEASVSWSHTRPDGRNGLSVLGDYGYGYAAAGESLYFSYGSDGAEEILNQWMNSKANQENILNTTFTSVGIGVYRTADGLTHVAAIFVG